MFQAACYDGNDYAIKIKYMGPEVLDVIKNGQIRGFYVGDKLHPLAGHWRFYHDIFDREELKNDFIGNMARASGWPLDKVKANLNEALENAVKRDDSFAWGIQQTIHLVNEEEMVVCGTAYHGLAVKVLKEMGAKWMKDARGWHLEGTGLHALTFVLTGQAGYKEDQIFVRDGLYSILSNSLVLRAGDGKVLPYVEYDTENLNRKRAEENKSGQLAASIGSIQRTGLTPEIIESLIPDGMALPHQIEGIVFLAQRTGGLIAYDMGTGKTRISIFAANIVRQYDDKKRVLVAAPKSVIRKWKREILSVLSDTTAEVFDGDEIPESDWVITNYERLEKLYPVIDQFSSMLVDEAHKLKEVSSLRTRAAFELASRIKHRWMLTATPVLNREGEIHSLLRLTGHPIGNLEPKEFLERFSGSREFRNALNKEISGEWMIRRLQSEVLRDKLPGKTRHYETVQFNKKQATEYIKIIQEPTYALARLHNARKMLEHLKIADAKAYLKSIPRDEKLVVFVERIDSLDAYAEALSSKRGGRFVTLSGKHSDTERDTAVMGLQEDDAIRGIVGTYGAMAEGIDLWRANHVFLASQPWTPAIQAQAEDRCNRLGQTRKVTVRIPVYQGSLDEDMRALIDAKFEIANDILDPGESEKEAQRAIARRMARPVKDAAAKH